MRFFFAHTPFFALLPTIAVADQCGCEDPECDLGGWNVAIVWAGFAAGI